MPIRPSITFNVDGGAGGLPAADFEQLVKARLQQLRTAILRRLPGELESSVLPYLRQAAPYRTGKLRASARVWARAHGPYSFNIAVGYDIPYAAWVPAARRVVQGTRLRSLVQSAVRAAVAAAVREVSSGFFPTPPQEGQ